MKFFSFVRISTLFLLVSSLSMVAMSSLQIRLLQYGFCLSARDLYTTGVTRAAYATRATRVAHRSIVDNQEILESAIDLAGDIRGLSGVIDKVCAQADLESVKGFVFEALVAVSIELDDSEEQVVAVGAIGKMPGIKRELDVITTKRVIECKAGKLMKKAKEQISDQMVIAENMGLDYELHVQRAPTKHMQKWLRENGVTCYLYD